MATGTIDAAESGDTVTIQRALKGVAMVSSLTGTITATLEVSYDGTNFYPVETLTAANDALQLLQAPGIYRYTGSSVSGGEFDWIIQNIT